MSNSLGQSLQIDSRTEIDSQLGDAKSFVLRIFSLLTRNAYSVWFITVPSFVSGY